MRTPRSILGLGLVALILFFAVLKGHTFLSLLNFSNLLNQGAAVIVIAMGLIFVLLLVSYTDWETAAVYILLTMKMALLLHSVQHHSHLPSAGHWLVLILTQQLTV